MTFELLHWPDLGVRAEWAAFQPAGGVSEHHLMLHVEPRGTLFSSQLERLYMAEERLAEHPILCRAQAVMKRYFLSDAANQAPLMRTERNCAVSLIQQPPLDGSKIAAWLYLQEGTSLTQETDTTLVRSNGYEHLWLMGLHATQGNSAEQTTQLLDRYAATLAKHGANMADHCVRTWFFVRDVDTQYGGLVRARLEHFHQHGLTPQTHYISSTGIQGLPAAQQSLIQLGTYALTGFAPEQMSYLRALTHLNPTIEYGVTFERGTLLRFGDRAQAYISGTASIDNRGEVVHVGNIELQTRRMLENVEALLAEAGMNIAQHVAQIIVYLRDTADYPLVQRMFAERFTHIPTVITLAPVCRPEWLIEMECIALNEERHEAFRPF